jgi:hypothetical protein
VPKMVRIGWLGTAPQMDEIYADVTFPYAAYISSRFQCVQKQPSRRETFIALSISPFKFRVYNSYNVR